MYEFSLLPFNPKSFPEKFPHESDGGLGWQGLETWIIQDDNGDIWDVDWRFAYGNEIFKQHLIDIGWNEDKLLYRSKHKDPIRRKAIIYICDTGIEIPRDYSGLAECGETKQQKAEIIEETINQENIVKSPMVGVAYLSADPNSPPYVKVDQHVKQGDTLLLIEAMKTFNEIKAPKSGVIKKIVVLNSQPVEFGDDLIIFE